MLILCSKQHSKKKFYLLCEKVFKLVSDLSLLEYADTNTDLLRTLAKDAPGTFHHSLQVSHLAESVAIEIMQIRY